MHFLDPQHLLTIGYDAADKGNFAYFQGVMLQIFDVADPANTQLLHKEVIGTRGSSSEALTNHLAFTYFPARSALALPITECEAGPDKQSSSAYGKLTFSGVRVYVVDARRGFGLQGKVAHPTDAAPEYFCHNWWTRASSEVKRTLFYDDYLFSISGGTMKVNHLDSLKQDVTVFKLK